MKVYVVYKETSYTYGKEEVYSICKTEDRAFKDLFFIENNLKVRARFEIMEVKE